MTKKKVKQKEDEEEDKDEEGGEEKEKRRETYRRKRERTRRQRKIVKGRRRRRRLRRRRRGEENKSYLPPNSILWGSLLRKNQAGRDMLWPRCPPCVHFGRTSKPCPACVRQVSPLCLIWPCLQTLSAMCPPCVCHVSAMCLPCVRHVSAMCPPCVRLVSALCPPLAAPQTLSGMCPPCVRLGRARKPCPPCARLVFVRLEPALNSKPCLPCPPYVRCGIPSKPRPPCVGQALCPPRLVSALCRLWPRLQALRLPCCPLCPPCVRSLSFFVLSLSARCSLLIRSLSVWPGLCQLCVRSLVFAPLSVLCPMLPALVEVFVAAPLPAVRLVTFSRQCSCLP